MTVFAPEEFTPGLVERLQDNGELSVTIDAFPSHETYQFKGRYRAHRVADSGEGRWTIDAAIEEAVPVDVLAAALFARFRSRVEESYADQLLSAMRFGFGGHVEVPQ